MTAELAEDIARRVARELLPGMGSMVVPDPAAAVFERNAGPAGYTYHAYIAGAYQSDHILMKAEFRQDATLALELEVNGQYRVWSGVLRRAGYVVA